MSKIVYARRELRAMHIPGNREGKSNFPSPIKVPVGTAGIVNHVESNTNVIQVKGAILCTVGELVYTVEWPGVNNLGHHGVNDLADDLEEVAGVILAT